jgi:CRISPR-associated protein Cas1
VGLDPYLGFFHSPRYGRPALALDMMEEFRPLIADSVVLTMINRGEVSKEDFAFTTKGVILRDSGRRQFWRAWARRMDTEITHPTFGYKMSYRRMLHVQMRQFWRFCRGDIFSYNGFTTR